MDHGCCNGCMPWGEGGVTLPLQSVHVCNHALLYFPGFCQRRLLSWPWAKHDPKISTNITTQEEHSEAAPGHERSGIGLSRGAPARWIVATTLKDSRYGVVDVKFAPRHLGLRIASASEDG